MKCRCGNAEAVIAVGGINGLVGLCEKCMKSEIKSGVGPMAQLGGGGGGLLQRAAAIGGQQAQDQGVQETGERLVDEFGGRDLTERARDGKINEVIGRDEIISKIITTLNKEDKNNPILIGEPGVGKTAIAEGLAKRIADGNVPSKLKNKKVIAISASDLIRLAPPMPGMFEQKIQEFMDEVAAREDVILFMDEIHLLVEAKHGGMDAGNLLKPALARGELSLVGATTFKEYRKMTRKDNALERRFQPIKVEEPKGKEALTILKGVAAKYSASHGVVYPDDVVEACLELSNRYIQNRFQPDKGADILDVVGAKLNLTIESVPEEIARLESEKERATETEDFLAAKRLRDEIIALEEKQQKIISGEIAVTMPVATVEDIRIAIEEQTGVPVSKLEQDRKAKILNLASQLTKRVIGQEEAVQAVSQAVKRNAAGLQTDRPNSFLFVGPTGVGKTELAKALAAELYEDKESMIRLDMSEFSEKHTTSKLIGSPPGYIGFEEAGQLTEKVKNKPHCIVLFDEIEKAHPDVLNMLLQVLDDGHMTDAQGTKISFKDTTIIMTSNAGVGLKETAAVGFGTAEVKRETDLSKLTQFFKPEFLNRFDKVVKFNHLEKEHLVQIVDILLLEVETKLSKQKIALKVDQAAKEKLAENGYDPAFGARPLRRAIQDNLEDLIADILLEKEVTEINVTVENSELHIA